MKPTILLSFLLLFGLTACKKDNSDPDVDPRQQYLGTFAINYSSTTTVGGQPNGSDSGQGSITFSPGSATDELQMVINFPNYADSVVAKINDSQFTLERTRNKVQYLGQTYDGEYIGTGSISGQTLMVNATTRANANGSDIIWTQLYKGTKQ